MKNVVIQAQPRTELGSKASGDLRRKDQVPCVLYGGGEVLHFHAHINDLFKTVHTATFTKVTIELNGKSYETVVKDMQFNPVTDKLTHLDFQLLEQGKKFRASVPIKLVGSSKGVKEGGTLIQKMRKVIIITLPEHAKEVLEVDITALELGKSIRVRDIPADEHIQIVNSPSIPVATIDIPRALRSAQTKATDTKGKKK